ncbi:SLC13 family permease [Campylobacter fetus]|uniref:SLC13 family permease n=2 Tax=Campylobacter fetus TaxID=196 RepID=UPI00081889E9|nr:SLC13 family permease [Campylobacter fetus]EAH8299736.1 hypothetical protein [Campylobacter fetus]EAI7232334.1 hypothetical protein [Campylobacter fetus]EAJ5690063.1 hypothetical protein [Campylobacter fetus]EAK0428279.1 hypothetical protein [Campylobacter fetus]EAK5303954.1 hypothetical protein [Campylobacter fetus]
MQTIQILIPVFLIGSIILGYLYKTNIGIFAIPLAFIAAFIHGLEVKNIINLWGLNLFFILISMTFFYGFAISNGTLNLLASKAIYVSRNQPWAIPIVLFIIVAMFVGIAGHYAGFAFMSPLVLYIANKINMSKMLAAIIIYSGSCASGFNPFTIGGRFVNSIILNLGFNDSVASDFTVSIYKNMFFVHTLIFIVGYFVLKGYTVHANKIEKPAKLSKIHIKTISLVAFIFALVMAPSIWLAFVPHSVFMQKASDILNPIFLCFLGVCLAIIFNIGDEKEAFRNIPWDIVFMICGLGMLIALAKEAGAIDKLSIYINSVSTDEHTIAYLLGISSSTMSIFSSTLGVVIPTFFPIIPNLNIDIALGLSIVVCFATFTGYSPFSTGGALVLAGTKDPKESKELFIGLLVLPAILVLGGFALLIIGFFN